MKAAQTLWKYTKPTETMLIMFGVFAFLAIVTAITMYRNSENKFNGQVRYENLSPETRRQVESVAEDIRLGEDDSNLRYAERIREASSIGLGLSLYIVRERVSSDRVLTLPQMMDEFAKSDVLPPSCKVLLPDKPTDYGLVQTARGIYYIRYQSSPLKLEILSSGADPVADGSTFILRVPDTSAAKIPIEAGSNKVKSAGAWATIFEAPASENYYIPPPFAPVQSYAAMNWQVRALQQTELSPERMQKINEYLQRQN
jgi:hypothetical protein